MIDYEAEEEKYLELRRECDEWKEEERRINARWDIVINLGVVILSVLILMWLLTWLFQTLC